MYELTKCYKVIYLFIFLINFVILLEIVIIKCNILNNVRNLKLFYNKFILYSKLSSIYSVDRCMMLIKGIFLFLKYIWMLFYSYYLHSQNTDFKIQVITMSLPCGLINNRFLFISFSLRLCHSLTLIHEICTHYYLVAYLQFLCFRHIFYC